MDPDDPDEYETARREGNEESDFKYEVDKGNFVVGVTVPDLAQGTDYGFHTGTVTERNALAQQAQIALHNYKKEMDGVFLLDPFQIQVKQNTTDAQIRQAILGLFAADRQVQLVGKKYQKSLTQFDQSHAIQFLVGQVRHDHLEMYTLGGQHAQTNHAIAHAANAPYMAGRNDYNAGRDAARAGHVPPNGAAAALAFNDYNAGSAAARAGQARPNSVAGQLGFDDYDAGSNAADANHARPNSIAGQLGFDDYRQGQADALAGNDAQLNHSGYRRGHHAHWPQESVKKKKIGH